MLGVRFPTITWTHGTVVQKLRQLVVKHDLIGGRRITKYHACVDVLSFLGRDVDQKDGFEIRSTTIYLLSLTIFSIYCQSKLSSFNQMVPYLARFLWH